MDRHRHDGRGTEAPAVRGDGRPLAADLLATGRAHRFHLFLAPRIFGPDGPGLVAPTALEDRYRSWRSHRVGEDVEWILRRRDLPTPPA